MHTTDNQGTVSRSPLAHLMRDLRVGWRLAMMVAAYLTVGGVVRRRVRRLAARGEVYFVDRHHPRSR